MYLTLKVPLYATEHEKKVMESYGVIFHQELETIINYFNAMNRIVFYPYKWLHNTISFYSKSDVIRLAEIFYEKRKQNVKARYKPLFSLLSRSYIVKQNLIILFFGKAFHPECLNISIALSEQQIDRLKNADFVKLDIRKMQDKYVARIIISIKPLLQINTTSLLCMGVDIGMKCPAVCYTSNGKIKFIGNGREIKYHLRRLHKKYCDLLLKDSAKNKIHQHKIKNFRMFIDHKVSKNVVAFAYKEGVKLIYLEKLTNMQKKFENHNLMCWSYLRLQTYIEYKAELLGIKVIYVNPYLTTKRCPKCNKINNVKGRDYQCSCGFHMHRDIVGAMNILHAPKINSIDLP